MSRFIFCVDSDGCAMDTMTYKHELFFGPLASKHYNVRNKEQFQKNWEEINLYSTTRGVNRFVGLVLSLESIDYTGIDNLKEWVETTDELSNQSLEKEIEKKDSEDLKLALAWSIEVNQAIADATGHDEPFEGTLETLADLAEVGDVYVVSSANREAVEKEWSDHGLLTHVKDLYCQDRGKKADVIKTLKESNPKATLMMIGDSPGDLEAAEVNDVFFYPIIVNEEKNSWYRLKNQVKEKFVTKDLGQGDQESLINEFWNNLK